MHVESPRVPLGIFALTPMTAAKKRGRVASRSQCSNKCFLRLWKPAIGSAPDDLENAHRASARQHSRTQPRGGCTCAHTGTQ